MEKEHPINQILQTSLENVARMIDTGKIVGQPIILGDNKYIIPISKVSFGFGAAGSEFTAKKAKKDKKKDRKAKEYIDFNTEVAGELAPRLPEEALFGGGSGGGVSITPSSFIIISTDHVELKSIDQKSPALEKIFEFVSRFINKEDKK